MNNNTFGKRKILANKVIMKRSLFLFLISVLVLISSCSDLKVTADYDKDTDFSNYKTFNIMHYEEGAVESTSLSMMTISFIEEAIIDELMKRGYTLSDDPDLEVYYYVKLKDKTSYNTSGPSVGMYYGSPYYYGYHGGYTYTGNIQSVDYTEGSLIVELVDAKMNKAVWQGIAVKSVTQESANQRAIQQIINRVFFDYKWTVEGTDQKQQKSTSKKVDY